MTVAGIEKVIPALGIEKMPDDGVPQATLDRVAPGVIDDGHSISATSGWPTAPLAQSVLQIKRIYDNENNHGKGCCQKNTNSS